MTKRILAAVLLLCLFVSVVYAQSAATVFGWPPADGSVTNAKLAEPVSVANGGTGKTTAAEALAALGGASLNGSSTVNFSGGSFTATARYLAADGTAAAPAYSFSSDPDTGIYSYGSNSIGFSVGGLSHSYLWKSGKYNLFTNPTTDGNDDECLWLGHGDRSRGAGLLLYGNESTSYNGVADIYIGTNGVFIITGNGGAESMKVIASTSNVLIDTSTDDGANKLQVNGSMRLVGGAAPTAIEGAIYFNSTDKHFYGYNGTAWVQLDN